MTEETEKKMSDFNEAGLQVLRLHRLSLQYSNCWIDDPNYSRAKWILDQFWIELTPDARDEDKNKPKEETYYFKIDEANNKITNAKNRNELYHLLQEKRILLKLLQEDVGKGSKKSKQRRKVM